MKHLTFAFILVCIIPIVIGISMCTKAEAHETCFWKHSTTGSTGKIYGYMAIDFGIRVAYCTDFDEGRERRWVRGLRFIPVFPDGDPGRKKLVLHKTKEYYVKDYAEFMRIWRYVDETCDD